MTPPSTLISARPEGLMASSNSTDYKLNACSKDDLIEYIRKVFSFMVL